MWYVLTLKYSLGKPMLFKQQVWAIVMGATWDKKFVLKCKSNESQFIFPLIYQNGQLEGVCYSHYYNRISISCLHVDAFFIQKDLIKKNNVSLLNRLQYLHPGATTSLGRDH